MHRLITLAESEGAVNVKIISARDVVVDERTRLKCQVPLCPHYNRALLCPPHVPPVSWFKSVLDRYERVLLLQVRAPVREGASDQEEVLQGAVKLHRIVNKVERAAYNWGFRFAAGLIGGNCRLCPECVGVHSNLPCRHPYEARPSMEAMGIDVGETLAKVGLTLKFPPEKEVFWTGMVLLD